MREDPSTDYAQAIAVEGNGASLAYVVDALRGTSCAWLAGTQLDG